MLGWLSRQLLEFVLRQLSESFATLIDNLSESREGFGKCAHQRKSKEPTYHMRLYANYLDHCLVNALTVHVISSFDLPMFGQHLKINNIVPLDRVVRSALQFCRIIARMN